jgi:hypothetical protein
MTRYLSLNIKKDGYLYFKDIHQYKLHNVIKNMNFLMVIAINFKKLQIKIFIPTNVIDF